MRTSGSGPSGVNTPAATSLLDPNHWRGNPLPRIGFDADAGATTNGRNMDAELAEGWGLRAQVKARRK